MIPVIRNIMQCSSLDAGGNDTVVCFTSFRWLIKSAQSLYELHSITPGRTNCMTRRNALCTSTWLFLPLYFSFLGFNNQFFLLSFMPVCISMVGTTLPFHQQTGNPVRLWLWLQSPCWCHGKCGIIAGTRSSGSNPLNAVDPNNFFNAADACWVFLRRRRHLFFFSLLDVPTPILPVHFFYQIFGWIKNQRIFLPDAAQPV